MKLFRFLPQLLCFGGLWLAGLYPVRAQQADWQAYPSVRETLDLVTTPTQVWVATRGGLYRYGVDNQEVKRYSTIDGLHHLVVTAVTYDAKRNALWLGFEDGVLNKLDLTSQTFSAYRDVARAEQYASRAINRLVIEGDSLLVATAFGLIVFDPIKAEVRDSYTQFADNAGLTTYDVVTAPLLDGRKGIWVAMEKGVAYAPLKNTNLRDPSVWTVDTRMGKALSINRLGNTVVLGSVLDGAHLGLDGNWERMGYANGNIRRIVRNDAGTYICVISAYWADVRNSVGEGARLSSSDYYYDYKTCGFRGERELWVGDGLLGVARFTDYTMTGYQKIVPTQQVLPNGPYLQVFTSLSQDSKGRIWAGAASDLFGTLYRMEGATWKTFAPSEIQNKKSLDRVYVDADDHVWTASSRNGQGLLDLAPDGTVTVYQDTNSSLRAISGYPGDIRISGMGKEKDGTLWALNYLSTPRVHTRSKTGVWTGMNTFYDQNGSAIDGDYLNLFIDSYGKKWIGVYGEGGFFVWDTKGTPTNQADDKIRFWSGKRSDGKGLPSPVVRAFAEDRKGGIWVGTNRGLTVFVFGNLATETDPNWPARDGSYVLREANVNSMDSDAANRMWIATTEGVWVVDAASYEILAHYTSENTPLYSDNVTALWIDDDSGLVYMATDLGLISLQTDARPAEAYPQDLAIYPNPVQVTAGQTPRILIGRLMEDSEIRIINVAGRVVAQFHANGGQTTWNGLDEQGQLVPSGVYIVVATSSETGERSYGKLGIIR